MQYVMSLKNVGRKRSGSFFHHFYQLFANPVSFNTIYHNIINVVPYMFNSFSIERNITKI